MKDRDEVSYLPKAIEVVRGKTRIKAAPDSVSLIITLYDTLVGIWDRVPGGEDLVNVNRERFSEEVNNKLKT